ADLLRQVLDLDRRCADALGIRLVERLEWIGLLTFVLLNWLVRLVGAGVSRGGHQQSNSCESAQKTPHLEFDHVSLLVDSVNLSRWTTAISSGQAKTIFCGPTGTLLIAAD